MKAVPALAHGMSAETNLLITGAHVLDPRSDLDELADVLVRGGQIVQIAAAGELSAGGDTEVAQGEGKHLLPAFVDPHVHLRSPGQEHKEDLETGTRAAAVGGFCAVIAMPNTDPVIDSAPLLRSLREAATREARVPVGFLAAITRGLAGGELTEMAELMGEGALGFTDDGRPVASAGVLRKALQYQRLCGGVLTLHEEDPSLSHGGSMHEGAVSAALGIGGIPSVSESTMVARDAELAGYEDGRVHFQHLSCAASVHAVATAKERGFRVSAEVTPHHLLLTDEHVRVYGHAHEDEPAAGERSRSAGPNRRLALRHDRLHRDRPCPARAPRKGGPLRAGPDGHDRPGDGLRRACTPSLCCRARSGSSLLVERMTAGADLFGLPTPRIAVGEPANLTLCDLSAEWVAGEQGWESRSENCCFAGRRLTGRVLMTVAAGAVAYRKPAFSVVGS